MMVKLLKLVANKLNNKNIVVLDCKHLYLLLFFNYITQRDVLYKKIKYI